MGCVNHTKYETPLTLPFPIMVPLLTPSLVPAGVAVSGAAGCHRDVPLQTSPCPPPGPCIPVRDGGKTPLSARAGRRAMPQGAQPSAGAHWGVTASHTLSPCRHRLILALKTAGKCCHLIRLGGLLCGSGVMEGGSGPAGSPQGGPAYPPQSWGSS